MNNSRPQILYLVHRVPFPPNRGDRIRSFHILDFLSKRADVHLATLADEPITSETTLALQSRCKNLAIERLGKTRWLRATKGLVCGNSATEGLFRSPRLHQTVCRWANQTHFDAAVVCCSSMVQYLSAPALGDVPAVIDFVDVDSQKWFDYAATAFGLKRLLFRLEGRRTRQLEAIACRRADSIVLVSEAEAELFRRVCPNDHTYSVPNGVDLDYFRYLDGEGIPGRCVFIGALDYRANVDGICWFCREVWPQVRRMNATATLAIVGRNPVPIVNSLQSVPGVEVFASVADVRPYLAEASVVVVPLRIARGIQNKVLEAMSFGRPVVASAEAIEGLDVVPDVHARVLKRHDDWARCIVDLLDDAFSRNALAVRGREFVESHHDWDSCLAPLSTLLRTAIPSCDVQMSEEALRSAVVNRNAMIAL